MEEHTITILRIQWAGLCKDRDALRDKEAHLDVIGHRKMQFSKQNSRLN